MKPGLLLGQLWSLGPQGMAQSWGGPGFWGSTDWPETWGYRG